VGVHRTGLLTAPRRAHLQAADKHSALVQREQLHTVQDRQQIAFAIGAEQHRNARAEASPLHPKPGAVSVNLSFDVTLALHVRLGSQPFKYYAAFAALAALAASAFIRRWKLLLKMIPA